MALDPSIILAGQPVNVLGALSAGNQVAAQTNEMRRAADMQNLYRTQGAGILAGDQNALNALAGFDPMAAMEVKGAHQGMRMREQEMATARENARIRALELTASMDAATKQAEAAKLEQGLAAATQITDAQTWDQYMSQVGLNDLVGRFGEKDILIAGALGLADALKMAQPQTPEWRQATPEEAASYGAQAGQINEKTGQFKPFNPPSGMRIDSDGRGGISVIQGPGAMTDKAAAAAEKEVSRAGLMLEDIGRAKEILKANPNLTSGLLGNYLKDWAGTPAADLKALLDTIRANIGFKELNEMRQASPTGGALGQVTERELALLQATLGNVEQSQSAEQLAYNLTRLEQVFNEIVNGPAAPAGSQPQGNLGLDDEALIQKYLGTGQ